MLVFAKNPRGVLCIFGYKIYGSETGQKPCDIPYAIYVACKESIVDATYREGYMRKYFDPSCPEIAFTYSELRFLPAKTLNILCKVLKIKSRHDWTNKRKIEMIKRILRDEPSTT